MELWISFSFVLISLSKCPWVLLDHYVYNYLKFANIALTLQRGEFVNTWTKNYMKICSKSLWNPENAQGATFQYRAQPGPPSKSPLMFTSLNFCFLAYICVLLVSPLPLGLRKGSLCKMHFENIFSLLYFWNFLKFGGFFLTYWPLNF